MDFLAESLPTLFGAASAAVPLLQSQRHHQREMETAIDLHKQAISQAEDFHIEDKEIAWKLHRAELQKALEMHLEDMQLTIEAARRENLRDVWAQKSRRAETLMIMTTLMIGGFFSLVVEGIFPENTWGEVIIVYSICLSLGFSGLFIALFITMKAQSRMSDFNIYNVKQVYTCGRRHESYEAYYDCHVRRPYRYATYSFYLGTCFLLISAGFMQLARWYLQYNNQPAGLIYMSVLAIFFVCLVIIQCLVPTKTRSTSEAEDAEQDARRMDEGRMGSSPPLKKVLTPKGSGFLKRNGTKVKRRREKEKSTKEASSMQAYLNKLTFGHDMKNVSSPGKEETESYSTPLEDIGIGKKRKTSDHVVDVEPMMEVVEEEEGDFMPKPKESPPKNMYRVKSDGDSSNCFISSYFFFFFFFFVFCFFV